MFFTKVCNLLVKVPHSGACHSLERYPNSSVWLGEHGPDKLVKPLWFVPGRHPNSTHNECLDLRWLGARFRFFLPTKVNNSSNSACFTFSGCGRVHNTTFFAPIRLTARLVQGIFHLWFTRVTLWTLHPFTSSRP